MSQFNLPTISPKNAGIILGGLAIFIIAIFSFLEVRPMEQLSYGTSSVVGVPAYDESAQGGYAKNTMFARGEAGMADSAIMPMPPYPAPARAPIGEEKIVKEGTLALLVADVDVAAREVGNIRTRFGGAVGNSTFREYTGGVRGGEITIWVPAADFDAAIIAIKQIALRVHNESVNVSDVSAQFVDLEARLKNLRATEAQYIEIMKRSGKLSEVLEVTRELSNTRSQIEQLEGERNYLSRQVALSAIHISLTEEAGPSDLADEWRPLSVIKSAAKEALSGLTDFVDGILVLIVLLPLLLLKLASLALLLWVLYRALRALYVRVIQVVP